jgi:hypothetical protein
MLGPISPYRYLLAIFGSGSIGPILPREPNPPQSERDLEGAPISEREVERRMCRLRVVNRVKRECFTFSVFTRRESQCAVRRFGDRWLVSAVWRQGVAPLLKLAMTAAQGPVVDIDHWCEKGPGEAAGLLTP